MENNQNKESARQGITSESPLILMDGEVTIAEFEGRLKELLNSGRHDLATAQAIFDTTVENLIDVFAVEYTLSIGSDLDECVRSVEEIREMILDVIQGITAKCRNNNLQEYLDNAYSEISEDEVLLNLEEKNSVLYEYLEALRKVAERLDLSTDVIDEFEGNSANNAPIEDLTGEFDLVMKNLGWKRPQKPEVLN